MSRFEPRYPDPAILPVFVVDLFPSAPFPTPFAAHRHHSSPDVSTGLTSILVVRKLLPVTLTPETDGTTFETPSTVLAYRLSDLTLQSSVRMT